MLLTLSTTHAPATDLGYLLHTDSTKARAFDLPFGRAHVLYPETTPDRYTAVLLLEINTVGLACGQE